jgi:polyferredoxin
MDKYKIFATKRRLKQYLSSIVFLFILIAGAFYPLLGYFIPLCMVLGLVSGFSHGRKWCDWFCPRGSFFDALIRPISPKKEIPRLLKNHPFRIAVFVFLMSVMAINLILRWPDPDKIGRFFMIMLYITTAAGIILALIFHQRSWCSFCPIGSLINWTSRDASHLKIDSAECVECKLCFRTCRMQIKPFLFKGEDTRAVRDRDCLRCGLCVAVCPKDALSTFPNR